jgi:polyferredoxin
MLADFILLLHFGYVAFVVGGFVLIWIGFACRWEFVRNRWFRLLHLLAMGFVLAEALCGVTCPLTVWENALRGETRKQSFMQYWVGRLMFHEWSETTFIILYAVVFILIVATLLVVPPRWRSTPAAPSAK